MDTVIWKLIFVGLMFFMTLLFGLLPMKVLKLLRHRAAGIENSKWPSLILCMLTCFSGGVFLASCFLHLLPEATSHLAQIKQQLNWDIDYPLAELISCLGFFLIFFLEEVVLLIFPTAGHSHGNPAAVVLNESIGLDDSDSAGRKTTSTDSHNGNGLHSPKKLSRNGNNHMHETSMHQPNVVCGVGNSHLHTSTPNRHNHHNHTTVGDRDKQRLVMCANHGEDSLKEARDPLLDTNSHANSTFGVTHTKKIERRPKGSDKKQQQQTCTVSPRCPIGRSTSPDVAEVERSEDPDVYYEDELAHEQNDDHEEGDQSTYEPSPHGHEHGRHERPLRAYPLSVQQDCQDHTKSLPRINQSSVSTSKINNGTVGGANSQSIHPHRSPPIGNKSIWLSREHRSASVRDHVDRLHKDNEVMFTKSLPGKRRYLCSDQRCQRPQVTAGYGSFARLARSVRMFDTVREEGDTWVQSTGQFNGACELAEPERCELDTCAGVDEDPPILMVSRPHAHSHPVRSITFVLALSFHSIIEGMALGVQNDLTDVTALFVTVMVHKTIVAFSVGLQLARTHAHQLRWVFIAVFVLALMSPLGALAGITLQAGEGLNKDVKDVIIMVLEGLAVGTFLYVTFFEVLLHERDNEHPNMLKLFMIMCGFVTIGLLRLFDSHSHEGEHAHEESEWTHCMELLGVNTTTTIGNGLRTANGSWAATPTALPLLDAHDGHDH